MTIHETYMLRCLDLAKLGSGNVAPNPMVGAVLVHENRIIGEGYHQQYGGPHAEVNCINAVAENDRQLIPRSVMYVSLEPCAHHGKTPPCADLIIKNKIPKAYIGCRDPFTQVDGNGIEKLQAAGVETVIGVLENECKEVNKRFLTFHTKHRPYIILKWAQTADGKINAGAGDRLMISNDYTNRIVHKWRAEEAAIMIGTNTAMLDDPSLTARLWPGHSPVRLVVDMDLRLPASLKIFNNEAKTIVFNAIKHEEGDGVMYYQVTEDVSLVHQVSNALYKMNIQSVLVEGGAKLLQSFIDEDIWDEARVITNEEMIINTGLNAPVLHQDKKITKEKNGGDSIQFYKHEYAG